MTYAVITTDPVTGHRETNIIDDDPSEVLDRYAHLLAHGDAAYEVVILTPWTPSQADLLDAADATSSKTNASVLTELAER